MRPISCLQDWLLNQVGLISWRNCYHSGGGRALYSTTVHFSTRANCGSTVSASNKDHDSKGYQNCLLTSSASLKEKRESSVAMVATRLTLARDCPTQLRGPSANGK